jgi:hypothetical protein
MARRNENRAGLLLIKPRSFVEEECADEVIDKLRFCEGFRMPAHEDDATYTGAGVRKPPKEETAGRDTSDGAACAIEDGVARNFDS